MAGTSLLDPLRELCAQDSGVPALIGTRGKRLSRKELIGRVNAIARGFIAAGLKPGDRVLFAVRPDSEAILLMLAIAEAGGVLVPLDTSMGPDLFRSRMKMLSPRWVVAESVLLMVTANRWIARLLGKLGLRIPPIAGLKNVHFVRTGPALPGVPEGHSTSAIEKLGEAFAAELRKPSADDPVIIVFTSGTTGEPKAVVHSRRSMWSVLEIIGKLMQAGPDDVVYARELHIILPTLSAGGSVVVAGRSGFKVGRTLRDLKRFQVTRFFGVASELQQMAGYLSARRKKMPEALREIWIGAAPIRTAFLQTLEKTLADRTSVWCVYGMTEILPVARVSLAEKIAFRGKGDLVGECVPGVTAGIAGNGELVLRGPNLFAGYVGEPPRTEHATGDLARLDNGRIVLLGRLKDMIIRGRFNIYPELYEATIERIPGVRRCAMVGIYDDAREEELVILAVEPGTGADRRTLEQGVWRALRSGPLRIDPEALPDHIIVMDLPVTGRSGKVNKQALREHAQQVRVS